MANVRKNPGQNVRHKVVDLLGKPGELPLPVLLNHIFEDMEARDKALCTELVYGVLRFEGRLRLALSPYAQKMDKLPVIIQNCLLLGTYELLFLSIPEHATVNEYVGLARRRLGARMAGLLNAVFRSVIREKSSILQLDAERMTFGEYSGMANTGTCCTATASLGESGSKNPQKGSAEGKSQRRLKAEKQKYAELMAVPFWFMEEICPRQKTNEQKSLTQKSDDRNRVIQQSANPQLVSQTPASPQLVSQQPASQKLASLQPVGQTPASPQLVSPQPASQSSVIQQSVSQPSVSQLSVSQQLGGREIFPAYVALQSMSAPVPACRLNPLYSSTMEAKAGAKVETKVEANSVRNAHFIMETDSLSEAPVETDPVFAASSVQKSAAHSNEDRQVEKNPVSTDFSIPINPVFTAISSPINPVSELSVPQILLRENALLKNALHAAEILCAEANPPVTLIPAALGFTVHGERNSAVLSKGEQLGIFSRQGLSSQYLVGKIAQFCREQHVSALWDACCGRGGKSCALLEQGIPVLLSSDPSQFRIKECKDQFLRLGLHGNAQVGTVQELVDGILQKNEQMSSESVSCATDFWKKGLWPFVLLDAPCTGSGTLGRTPELKQRLNPEKLASAEELQAELMRKAWECIEPGGFLAYATCSVFFRENEGQTANFLAACPDGELLCQENINPLELFGNEGLGHDHIFYALIRKTKTASGL